MHGFGLQIDLKSQLQADKIQQNQFSVKSQNPVLNICHLTTIFVSNHHVMSIFAKETKRTYFSVKSSWEVHWIIMFQTEAVCTWICGCIKIVLRILKMFDVIVPSDAFTKPNEEKAFCLLRGDK